MKILVDEMPKSPEACLFRDERYSDCFCRLYPHHYDLAECVGVEKCPYLKAIDNTNLAEKVSDLEWRHRDYSEEE